MKDSLCSGCANLRVISSSQTFLWQCGHRGQEVEKIYGFGEHLARDSPPMVKECSQHREGLDSTVAQWQLSVKSPAPDEQTHQALEKLEKYRKYPRWYLAS